MNVSIRDLRNHTKQVIEAVEAGEHVVLTKHGREIADITPRTERAEARPMAVVLAELQEIADLAAELDASPDPSDYDTGLTTDDMWPKWLE
jgi:prevent-host-death family protein